jgi:hypothetical protein
MHEITSRGTQQISRRALLGTLVGALGGLLIRPADARRDTGRVAPYDVSYWTSVGGPICNGGRLYQKRCEISCAGGTCETVQCIWVIYGTC